MEYKAVHFGLWRVALVLLLLVVVVESGQGRGPLQSTGDQKEHENELPKEPAKFRLISSGSGEDTEATKLGFKTFRFPYAFVAFSSFEAPDGERLTVRHCRFASAAEAKRYFEFKLLKLAKSVISQNVVKDKEGSVLGYRAEVAVASSPDGSAQSAVLWTSDADFRVIFANSLPDAVQLEKEYGKTPGAQSHSVR